MEQKIELKDAFSEFKKQKNIDRNIMISVLEDVFKTQLAKTYGRVTSRFSRTSR